MTPADQYRHLAAELHTRASNEPRADFKAEWNYLAYCYEVLAQHADKNGRTDVGQEPILNG
jgi:hypothetical protein